MYAKTSYFKDYVEIAEALEPLGFIQPENPGHFVHGLINYEFDFTACSVVGAMKVLFDRAIDIGSEGCQQRIREVIGA